MPPRLSDELDAERGRRLADPFVTPIPWPHPEESTDDGSTLRDLTEARDDDLLDFALVVSLLDAVLRQAHQATAAGDFHDGYAQSGNLAGGENLRELLFVSRGVIELGTCDGERATREQRAVKPSEGEGDAIGCEKQLAATEERRGR